MLGQMAESRPLPFGNPQQAQTENRPASQSRRLPSGNPQQAQTENQTTSQIRFEKMSSFAQHSYMIFDRFISNPPSEQPAIQQSMSRCAQWFNEANYLSWILISGAVPRPDQGARGQGQGQVPGDDPYQVIASCFATFYATLEERLQSIEILPEYEDLIKVGTDAGMREPEAKEFAIARIAAKNTPATEDGNGDQLAATCYLKYRRLLTQGLRWKRLIQAVGSWEVLLLDGSFPSSTRKGLKNDLSSAMLGAENGFRQYKYALLSPELGLMQTCQQLNGAVSLFQRIIEQDRMGGSMGPVELAQQFHGRIRAVFGPPQRPAARESGDNGEGPSRYDGPDDIEGDSANVADSSGIEVDEALSEQLNSTELL